MRIQRQREAFSWRLANLGEAEADTFLQALGGEEIPAFSLEPEAYAARNKILQDRLGWLRGDEYEERNPIDTRYLHGRVVKELKKDKNGNIIYKTNPDGSLKLSRKGNPIPEVKAEHTFWNRDRRQQQMRLEEELYAKLAANARKEDRALILGGMPGSGKGTVSKHDSYKSDLFDGFFVIDPDSIKELMASKGMIPDLVRGASPMEQSSVTHEEASEIAKRLAARAMRDGYNILWDITMSSPGSVLGRVNDLRNHGYHRVDAAFMEQTIDRAMRQAIKRHQGNESEYRRYQMGDYNHGEVPSDLIGSGSGGRTVPADLHKEANPKVPNSGWESSFGETFGDLRNAGVFDNTLLFDGRDWNPATGAPKVMTATGKDWGHYDPTYVAQPQPVPATPLITARRWFLAAHPESARGLLDSYENGELDFHSLIDALVQDWDSREKIPHNHPAHCIDAPQSWSHIYDRAETPATDDDTAFWVQRAESHGVLTPDEVDHIFAAMQQVEQPGL